MAGLIRLSEASSLALHAVCLLAGSTAETATVGQIAKRLRASEAHLAKVLQRLGKAGLVRSTRGPHGGFVLAREPGALTLFEVCAAVDGPPAATGCLLGAPVCQGECMFGGHLEAAARELLDYLRVTSVADLAGCAGNHQLGAVSLAGVGQTGT
ncbi:MAG: Rrf2 family transcriptional regulator [Chloroflexi bacterium]|nr:Rrf2 family transcriptional regulator [Chloroflexota bacterium]MCL5109161.1 Rrf2 family transcriptional regulator [Chloroflexota bacterium]